MHVTLNVGQDVECHSVLASVDQLPFKLYKWTRMHNHSDSPTLLLRISWTGVEHTP